MTMTTMNEMTMTVGTEKWWQWCECTKQRQWKKFWRQWVQEWLWQWWCQQSERGMQWIGQQCFDGSAKRNIEFCNCTFKAMSMCMGKGNVRYKCSALTNCAIEHRKDPEIKRLAEMTTMKAKNWMVSVPWKCELWVDALDHHEEGKRNLWGAFTAVASSYDIETRKEKKKSLSLLFNGRFL